MANRLLLLHRIDAPPPMGPILAVSDRGALLVLDFDTVEGRLARLLGIRFGNDWRLEEAAAPAELATAIADYLDGRLEALDHLATDAGGTSFQQQVWAELRRIPAGETRGYGQMAAMLGKPNAARAVGLANALNPLSIVVPCHRLIGSNGALTGYGGGIERKRWLLDHERRSRVGRPRP